MGRVGPAKALVEGYRTYTSLLGAMGHTVAPAPVADYLAGDDGAGDAMTALLSSAATRTASSDVSPEAVQRMDGLLRALADECHRVAAQAGSDDLPDGHGPLADALQARDSLAELVGDAILLNGHREYIQSRYLALADFRALLDSREDKGRFALVKLVPFLQQELGRRGFPLSEGEIRAFFEVCEGDLEVPHCLQHIMGGVNGEFRAQGFRFHPQILDPLFEIERPIGDSVLADVRGSRLETTEVVLDRLQQLRSHVLYKDRQVA